MAPAAISSANSAMASSGLRPNARRSRERMPPSLSNSTVSAVTARSRTFSHLDVCRQVCRHVRLGEPQLLHIRHGHDPYLLAVERQAHRDPRADAETAAD